MAVTFRLKFCIKVASLPSKNYTNCRMHVQHYRIVFIKINRIFFIKISQQIPKFTNTVINFKNCANTVIFKVGLHNKKQSFYIVQSCLSLQWFNCTLLKVESRMEKLPWLAQFLTSIAVLVKLWDLLGHFNEKVQLIFWKSGCMKPEFYPWFGSGGVINHRKKGGYTALTEITTNITKVSKFN